MKISIDILSFDELNNIFIYLNLNQICNMSIVNKELYNFCSCDLLWKYMTNRDFTSNHKIQKTWLSTYIHHMNLSKIIILEKIINATFDIYSSDENRIQPYNDLFLQYKKTIFLKRDISSSRLKIFGSDHISLSLLREIVFLPFNMDWYFIDEHTCSCSLDIDIGLSLYVTSINSIFLSNNLQYRLIYTSIDYKTVLLWENIFSSRILYSNHSNYLHIL